MAVEPPDRVTGMATRPLRVLFVNENLGGHATMHLAIEQSLRTVPDIDARFLHVPRPGLVRKLVGVEIPGLAAQDADLQPLRNQLAQSWWVRRRLRDLARTVDVVHAYTQNAVLLSAGELRRHATVVSTDATVAQHATMLPYRYPGRGTPSRVRLTKRLESKVYDAATLVVAQSEWAARSLRDEYGVRPERLRRIPFGIPIGESLPRVDTDPPEITFIGQSLRRKGGSRIIDLFHRRLAGRCVLNVVTPEPVAAVDGMRVFSDIFPGDRRLRELLARTAVLVFPSEIDTFGYAVVEAMAEGTPVVAVDNAALPELVDDGVTGLLVAHDDADELLCRAIETLLDDPDRRRAMGVAARAKALASYDARTTTDALVDVLREAVVLHRTR
jgi:glycosyltransferase involved in cell wall biosynthesis